MKNNIKLEKFLLNLKACQLVHVPARAHARRVRALTRTYRKLWKLFRNYSKIRKTIPDRFCTHF